MDVIERGPDRVRVRWTYFCVNMKDDSVHACAARRATSIYPNGLMLRRMSYETLMPEATVGYSTQPVELFGVLPAGALFQDLFPAMRRTETATCTPCSTSTATGGTTSSGARMAGPPGGDDATLKAISRSAGVGSFCPSRERLLFAVLGPASGFPADRNQLFDHSTPGAEGGGGWGAGLWDHWPIGWLNSQTSFWKPGSPYAYSFGSIGQCFVPPGKWIMNLGRTIPSSARTWP